MSLFLLFAFPLYIIKMVIPSQNSEQHSLHSVLQHRGAVYLGLLIACLAGLLAHALRSSFSPALFFLPVYRSSFLLYALVPYSILSIALVPATMLKWSVEPLQVKLYLASFFCFFNIFLSLSLGAELNTVHRVFYPLFTLLNIQFFADVYANGGNSRTIALLCACIAAGLVLSPLVFAAYSVVRPVLAFILACLIFSAQLAALQQSRGMLSFA